MPTITTDDPRVIAYAEKLKRDDAIHARIDATHDVDDPTQALREVLKDDDAAW